MLYHRTSFNYYVNIMFLRRLLVPTLLLPGANELVARVTSESPALLEGHRNLLRTFGIRYLLDGGLFLSNNTDGPGNPLSRVFSKREAGELFRQFSRVQFAVRYLNLRLFPGGRQFEQTELGHRLARRFGWHLYIKAAK